ncbi:hypothetical protein HaLaN_18802 [Haematococcus lacustris]|uniref:Uncharacterized protein n=1 Tax=Haematococcus lacustris TaxID=44745 RepID=A0A699ZFI2_HAELA|nr:hypothetical protein HaLaN_18802 [Haematococcus lacustris]
MLGLVTEEGVTSLTKLRNGALPDPGKPGKHIEGPKDSQVADRWDALLPDPRRQKLESPKHSFAQVVYTDGVAISVMFLRPKPLIKQAQKRWPDVILALAYGAACFNGSGTIGCRGVSVSQMLKEALR